MVDIAYKRILLKLSGEVLSEKIDKQGEQSMMDFIAGEVSGVVRSHCQVGIVIGGGNIIRGAVSKHNRVIADQVGMLATIINALLLKEAFQSKGFDAVIMNAFEVGKIVGRFSQDKAIRKLEKGKVVIFSGGTGNPYFSTDTAAALRALEIGASALIKGSKVDGVYDKDPMKYPKAKKFDILTYDEVIEKELKVMDLTAFALLKNSNIPVIVYKMSEPGMLAKVLGNKGNMSIVKS
jgi:uridylate kinase